MHQLRLFGGSAVLLHQKKRAVHEVTRSVFNVTGIWTEKLNGQLRLSIEKYWKDKLHAMDISVNNQASILHYSSISVAINWMALEKSNSEDLTTYSFLGIIWFKKNDCHYAVVLQACTDDLRNDWFAQAYRTIRSGWLAHDLERRWFAHWISGVWGLCI